MPDQTFYINVTVNPSGLLESWIIKWPNGTEDNTYFIINPQKSQVYQANEPSSIIFSLKAPTEEATYVLRVYVAGKSKDGFFADYKDLTVSVTEKSEEKPVKEPKRPMEKAALDCLSCHDVELKRHDRLGIGNNACYVCHDSREMMSLRLANGTLLSLDDAPFVCQQCHQDRYAAWEEGMHGKYGPYYAKVEGRVICSNCHDPHSPPFPEIPTLSPPQLSSEEKRRESTFVIPDGWFSMILIIGIALAFSSVVTKRRD